MYECACSCDYGDGDPADIYESKTVRARKAHKCCECQGSIQPGEQYEYVKVLCDGEWETLKTCYLCVRIRNDLCGGCWTHGSLWEDLNETNGIDFPWAADRVPDA